MFNIWVHSEHILTYIKALKTQTVHQVNVKSKDMLTIWIFNLVPRYPFWMTVDDAQLETYRGAQTTTHGHVTEVSIIWSRWVVKLSFAVHWRHLQVTGMVVCKNDLDIMYRSWSLKSESMLFMNNME